VMSIAYRILRNPEDARDVSQAVFIKAFGGLSSFNSRYKLFSWLYRIAINESLNFAGRRKRRLDPETAWKAESPDPSVLLEAVESARALDRAILKLKPHQQAVLALGAEGLSYADIGRTLHLPEKKVKSRLYEARANLREILVRSGWCSHA
jgi:RNA polymerase sigma-70 factor (ECF subfamily)